MRTAADRLAPVPAGTSDPAHFLFERYVDASDTAGVRRVYYALRPILPRALLLAGRRLYARRQVRRGFPRWPIEPVLVEHARAELLEQAREAGPGGATFTGYWPDGHRWAFVLTHDVEGPEGIERIGDLLEIERRHGVVSSWNFCGEQYPIPDGTFEMVREAGCEVALHGLDHSGRLFSSRQQFEEGLRRIHELLEAWGVEGFRAPALHRDAAWMPELGCLYDSSFPDTDPFEPFPGGCCSILPFLNGDLVELPVTLVQDHTLFEILREETIEVWVTKAEWIMANHGLVNVIVHPDYMDAPDRLERYEELIRFLAGSAGGWHALPRDVARWWRARDERGAEAPGAVRWTARDVGGMLVIEP